MLGEARWASLIYKAQDLAAGRAEVDVDIRFSHCLTGPRRVGADVYIVASTCRALRRI